MNIAISKPTVATVSVNEGAIGLQISQTETSVSISNVGMRGANGTNGTNGTNGVDGVGVPAGGDTGMVLVKSSQNNYETNWTDNLSSMNVHGGTF